MTPSDTDAVLSFDTLLALALAPRLKVLCSHCAALACPGWESWPGGLDPAPWQLLGRLGPAGVEPHYREYHPDGTRHDAAKAPIAPHWHPYNQCELIACPSCARPFLRYTEYGGYYIDLRVRELDAGLLVDAPPPSA